MFGPDYPEPIEGYWDPPFPALDSPNEVVRIREWLERIGDGRIVLPFADMDRTKAVPIAAWLANNLRTFRDEFPDERKDREHREREDALRRADKLEAEARRLRAATTGGVQ
jgi:hypothetical protein